MSLASEFHRGTRAASQVHTRLIEKAAVGPRRPRRLAGRAVQPAQTSWENGVKKKRKRKARHVVCLLSYFTSSRTIGVRQPGGGETLLRPRIESEDEGESASRSCSGMFWAIKRRQQRAGLSRGGSNTPPSAARLPATVPPMQIPTFASRFASKTSSCGKHADALGQK